MHRLGNRFSVTCCNNSFGNCLLHAAWIWLAIIIVRDTHIFFFFLFFFYLDTRNKSTLKVRASDANVEKRAYSHALIRYRYFIFDNIQHVNRQTENSERGKKMMRRLSVHTAKKTRNKCKRNMHFYSRLVGW